MIDKDTFLMKYFSKEKAKKNKYKALIINYTSLIKFAH